MLNNVKKILIKYSVGVFYGQCLIFVQININYRTFIKLLRVFSAELNTQVENKNFGRFGILVFFPQAEIIF